SADHPVRQVPPTDAPRRTPAGRQHRQGGAVGRRTAARAGRLRPPARTTVAVLRRPPSGTTRPHWLGASEVSVRGVRAGRLRQAPVRPALRASRKPGDGPADHVVDRAPRHPRRRPLVASPAMSASGCLSVVMPAYNEEATLAEITKAVLESPLVGQLVIVDD